jgi:hypothetical protein
MYNSQLEDKEQKEELVINKIIENFDDIHNPLPNYDELMPECDPDLISESPIVKINIASKVNSKEQEMLVELEGVIKNSKRNKRSHSVAFLKLNDLQVQIYGDNEIHPEKLLLYRKNFEAAQKDLKIVNEHYSKLNSYISYFYNEHLFIWNNPMLNMKNKKYKLIEFLEKFKFDINIEFENFQALNINFDYLNCLKGEYVKFLKYRFEVMYNYIRDARFLEELMKNK